MDHHPNPSWLTSTPSELSEIRPKLIGSWCQPCRVLSPLLQRLTNPDSGYDLMTIDVDEHPTLAAELKVTALPTVVAFKDGKAANKFGESTCMYRSDVC